VKQKKYSHHKRIAQGAAAIAVILSGGYASGNVVLHPGTITGKAGLLGSGLGNSGSIYARTSGGSFSGSTALVGNNFTLTTESGQTYTYAYTLQDGYKENYWRYLYTYYPQLSVVLPLDESVSVDLSRPSGTIAVHFDVTGGSVSSSEFSVGTHYNPQVYHQGYVRSGPSAQVDVAMGAGSAYVGSGRATIIVEDEFGEPLCTAEVPLGQLTTTVTAGSTSTVVYPITVDASACERATLEGDVGILNVPGNASPYQAWVSSNGPTRLSQELKSYSAADPIDHYTFETLQKGVYSPYAYLYFAAPYPSETLWLPNLSPQSVDLSNGGSATRDFVFNGGIVRGNLALSGPPAAHFYQGQRYYSGKWEYDPTTQTYGPTSGGWAYAPINPQTGAYSAILTEGSWLESATYLYHQRTVNNVSDWGYIAYSEPTNIPVVGGAFTDQSPQSLSVSEGLILFDVIEPAGEPTIGVSNPSVTARYYDPVRQVWYQSYSSASVSNAPTPGVRVVGPAGVYTFEAYATVRGTHARFATSTISIGQAVNTPAGTGVTIVPKLPDGSASPVTIEFPQVTGGGETSVSFTDVGPAAPADYDLLTIYNDDRYLNINTNATFPGTVEVCIQYNPADLGISESQESKLELQQYACSGASCGWTVINGVFGGDNGGSAVNTTTNTICGLTSSLGTFGITLKNVTSVPPTSSCIGLADDPIQRETSQGHCSLEIDNDNQLAGGCADAGGGLMSCLFNGAASQVLEPGSHTIAVTGAADDGAESSCSSYLSVVDREAPAIQCAAASTVECTGASTPVAVSASCGDNCEGCDASCGGGSYATGATLVACNATDAAGNSASCTTSVTVVDTTAPAISLTASPGVLWSPNHKLVAVGLTKQTSDACDPSPAVSCAATSNEPDNGLGDGDKPNDIQWIDGVLYLRAERSGLGTGRVYTVTCASKDASGNASSATTTVTVPHNQ